MTYPSAYECSCNDRKQQQKTQMEVAGQWRKEWAGAAEYGKVNLVNKLKLSYISTDFVSYRHILLDFKTMFTDYYYRTFH